jgi:mitogen-activated protein kinase organizer 1
VIRLYNPFPAATSGPVQRPQLIQTYTGHGYEVLSLAISSTNANFLSAGGDRNVFLWDVATAKTLRRFGGNQGHTARVNTVEYGAGESVIVSGSFDASVRIWDIKSNSSKPIQVLDEAKDSISAVVVREHEILTGSVDGRVRNYDLRMGRCTVDVLAAPVTSLSPMRDGRGYLVGTLDGTVRLMDMRDGACLMGYKGHANDEYRVRSGFGDRERYVLSGTEKPQGEAGDGEVVVWDTLTGTVMERVQVKGNEEAKRGVDGKKRINVITAVAWKDGGRGDQWCCAATDGLVTVYGS